MKFESELIYLTTAARRAGICVQVCERLAGGNDGFPEVIWIANRRYVARRRFERWLASKIGEQLPVHGHAPQQSAVI